MTFVASPRVERAFVLAMTAHSSQVRAGTSLPYIVHPVAVALSLAVYEDENLIIAALLHDAVEDTAVTLKQVDKMFGLDVRNLVDIVTKNPDNGWTRRERIIWISQQGLRAVRLKLGDVRHNKSDLPPEKESLRAAYDEAEAILVAAEAIYLAAATVASA